MTCYTFVLAWVVAIAVWQPWPFSAAPAQRLLVGVGLLCLLGLWWAP